MTFKIDENLPLETVDVIHAAGHHAVTASQQGLAGAEDEILAARVRQEKAVLITLDRDFSDIRTYRPEDYAGILVLRPKRQDKATVLRFVRQAMTLLLTVSPAGQLWIVEADRVRIR